MQFGIRERDSQRLRDGLHGIEGHCVAGAKWGVDVSRYGIGMASIWHQLTSDHEWRQYLACDDRSEGQCLRRMAHWWLSVGSVCCSQCSHVLSPETHYLRICIAQYYQHFERWHNNGEDCFEWREWRECAKTLNIFPTDRSIGWAHSREAFWQDLYTNTYLTRKKPENRFAKPSMNWKEVWLHWLHIAVSAGSLNSRALTTRHSITTIEHKI